MRNYDKINALPPEGIEHKRAHIVGAGIAGLAAAVFLVDDAHMPAANVTIYEKLPLVGGSMDGAGDAEHGYICRGERELEALDGVPLVPLQQSTLDPDTRPDDPRRDVRGEPS